MRNRTITYALLVALGGSSFGFGGPLTKLALADGWTWQQITFDQAFVPLVIFAACCLFMPGARKMPYAHDIVDMGALGIITSVTSVLYTGSLTMLPVPVALTLLFQFVWMGTLIQLIQERRWPTYWEVISIAAVLLGTALAAHLYDADFSQLSIPGMLLALGSAMSNTAFMYFSGRIGQDYAPAERGMFICLGATVSCFFLCPQFFSLPTTWSGLIDHGLSLALANKLVPVLVIGVGAKHISTGLSTIMASCELPAGILMSTALLGEPFDAIQAIGMVLVLCGVALAQAPGMGTAKAIAPPQQE